MKGKQHQKVKLEGERSPGGKKVSIPRGWVQLQALVMVLGQFG
jgi:hypothetical protein